VNGKRTDAAQYKPQQTTDYREKDEVEDKSVEVAKPWIDCREKGSSLPKRAIIMPTPRRLTVKQCRAPPFLMYLIIMACDANSTKALTASQELA